MYCTVDAEGWIPITTIFPSAKPVHVRRLLIYSSGTVIARLDLLQPHLLGQRVHHVEPLVVRHLRLLRGQGRVPELRNGPRVRRGKSASEYASVNVAFRMGPATVPTRARAHGEEDRARGRRRTWRAASTRAGHSRRGRKPRRKSALNSASRSSTETSWKRRGKLLDVQPFAWHARRLCVMRRTMVVEKDERKARALLKVIRCKELWA